MPIGTTALAALSVGSAVKGFFDDRSAAKGALNQANYQAGILDQNAAYADTEAKDAIDRGNVAVDQHAVATRQLIGSQRANLGAQGIALDSGSAADLQTESAKLGAIDEAQIRTNAAREAYGYTVQAGGYRAQANLARMGGKNTAQSYNNAGYSTLLTGASSVAGLYIGSSSRLTVPGPTGPAGSPNLSNIYDRPYVLPKMPRIGG